jgi:hypothetical protein
MKTKSASGLGWVKVVARFHQMETRGDEYIKGNIKLYYILQNFGYVLRMNVE